MFCATVTFIFGTLVTAPVFCVEVYVFTEMESFTNTVGNINIIERLDLRNSSTTCWRLCHRNSECSSYFENMITEECRLISTNLTNGEVVGETGWKYFGATLNVGPSPSHSHPSGFYYSSNALPGTHVKMRRQVPSKTRCLSHAGFSFDEEANLCFKFLTEEKIYRPAARENCTAAGGRFLQIKSEMQHNAVVKYMETLYPNYSPIIDGRRPDNDGTVWTFEDDEALSYFKWGQGQPENNRNCIGLSKEDDFNWASATCSKRNSYLCEVPLDGI